MRSLLLTSVLLAGFLVIAFVAWSGGDSSPALPESSASATESEAPQAVQSTGSSGVVVEAGDEEVAVHGIHGWLAGGRGRFESLHILCTTDSTRRVLEVTDQGRFCWSDAPDGSYTLVVQGANRWVRRDLARRTEVRPSTEPIVIDLTESVPSASLLVDVAAGLDAPDGLRVSLAMHSDDGLVESRAISVDSQVVAIEPLAAGVYEVSVEAPGYLPWHSGELTLAHGQSRRVGPVSLERGASVSIAARVGDVIVDRGDVQVIDLRGRVVLEGTVRPDATEFGPLPAGSYVVAFRGKRHAIAWREVALEAGQNPALELDLVDGVNVEIHTSMVGDEAVEVLWIDDSARVFWVGRAPARHEMLGRCTLAPADYRVELLTPERVVFGEGRFRVDQEPVSIDVR